MNAVVDTILNLVVFGYLGLLVWLALRPLPKTPGDQSD